MEWKGFECIDFTFEDHPAKVILPHKPRRNPTLVLKTEYFDAFPETELMLLDRGYTLGYIKNDHRWGGDADVERKSRFVAFVTGKYGLSPKCVPVGMSCGGMFALRLAAAHPEQIACMYLDAAVVNYMSCPGGFGAASSRPNREATFQEAMKALGFSEIGDFLAYRNMPLDHLPELVAARIPVIFVTGDSDSIVPYRENGYFVEQAYRAAGIEFELHVKPGADHHPHGLEDCSVIADFVEKHT